MDRNRHRETGQWRLDAAFLGWVLPGFGHWLLGERRRSAVLCATIGTLWLAGVLIGGLHVIDRDAHPWWFVAQSLTAPSIAVEYGKRYLEPIHGVGSVSEQGVLYIALAGLLNLLAMIDVAFRMPRSREQGTAPGPGAAAGKQA